MPITLMTHTITNMLTFHRSDAFINK